MKLSISAAARRAGVDRATIHRKIKDGKLSKDQGPDGEPLIDLSELGRVYPNALPGAHVRAQGIDQDNAAERTGARSELEAELAVLRERCAALTRERDGLAADKLAAAEREAKLIALAEGAQRLLVDRRPVQPVKRRSFLGRLFR